MRTTDPSTAQPLAIDVSGVSKVFATRSSHPVHALSDISFSIAQGEIVGLLGTNGAGKTTLFDLILGLTTPTSGNISVLGHTPHAAIRAAQIGAVLQTGGLLPELTVLDTLKMISSTFPDPLASRGNCQTGRTRPYPAPPSRKMLWWRATTRAIRPRSCGQSPNLITR